MWKYMGNYKWAETRFESGESRLDLANNRLVLIYYRWCKKDTLNKKIEADYGPIFRF